MGYLLLVLSQAFFYLIPQHHVALYLLELVFGLSCVLFAQHIYAKESVSIGFVFNVGLYLYYNGFIFNFSEMGIKQDNLLYLNIIVMIMGVFAFNLFYFAKPINKPRRMVYRIEARDFRLALYLLLVLGFLSFGSEIEAYGGLRNYILLGYGGERYAIYSKNISQIVGSGNIWIGLSLFSLIRFEDGKKKWRIIIVFLAIVWGSMNFIIGNRQILIYTALPPVLWGTFRTKKRIPFAMLLLLMVAALFLSKLYVLSRRYFIGNEETIIQVLQDRAKNDKNFFNVFDGDEFTYPALSLHESIADEGQERRWGATYLYSALNTIPFINKAFDYKSLAKSRMEKYYPSLDRQGLGLAFFFPTEAFINFGIFGIIFCFAVWGFLLKRLYERASLGFIDQLIYCYSVPILAIDSIRMDSSNYWKLIRIYWLPVAICFVLFWAKKNILKPARRGDGCCGDNVCLQK